MKRKQNGVMHSIESEKTTPTFKLYHYLKETFFMNELFLHHSIPLTDLRSFVEVCNIKEVCLNWQNNIVRKNFLKCFGEFTERKTGGNKLFGGEYHIISGINSIKFPELETSNSLIRRISLTYKRVLINDNSLVRFEFGFKIKIYNKFRVKDLSINQFNSIFSSILDLPISIEAIDNTSKFDYFKYLPLYLKKLYFLNTQKEEFVHNNDSKKMFIDDTISLFETESEIYSIELHSRKIGDRAKIYNSEKKGRNSTNTLLIKTGYFYDDYLGEPYSRDFRLGLFRLYAEYKNIKRILNFGSKTKLEINNDLFDNLINSKINYLNAVKNTKENSILKTIVEDFFSLYCIDNIQTLIDNFENIRLQIRRKLFTFLNEGLLKDINNIQQIEQLKSYIVDNSNKFNLTQADLTKLKLIKNPEDFKKLTADNPAFFYNNLILFFMNENKTENDFRGATIGSVHTAPNSTSTNNFYINSIKGEQIEIDYTTLSDELLNLKSKLIENKASTEIIEEVIVIEESTKQKDSSKILSGLKKIGGQIYDVCKDIAATLLAEIIKSQTGI